MLSNLSSVALRRCSTRSSLVLAQTAARVSSAVLPTTFLVASPSTSHSLFPTPHQQQQVSFFSSDTGSHGDFAPKKKAVDGQDEALKMIKEHVESNHVMLYMKGSPAMPMCGFSARVVDALKKEGVDFSSVNVLDYPAIREAVKKYAEWPTIPQLYVNGEFIGGCDIVMAMHESGELKDLLAEEKK